MTRPHEADGPDTSVEDDAPATTSQRSRRPVGQLGGWLLVVGGMPFLAMAAGLFVQPGTLGGGGVGRLIAVTLAAIGLVPFATGLGAALRGRPSTFTLACAVAATYTVGVALYMSNGLGAPRATPDSGQLLGLAYLVLMVVAAAMLGWGALDARRARRRQ